MEFYEDLLPFSEDVQTFIKDNYISEDGRKLRDKFMPGGEGGGWGWGEGGRGIQTTTN